MRTLLLALLIVTLLPANATVVTSPSTFNLGEIAQNSDNRLELSIANTGEAPEHVKIKTDCGCTTTESNELDLLPGVTKKIEIHYKPGLSAGSISKYITVITSTKMQSIPISANIDELCGWRLNIPAKLTNTKPIVLQLTPAKGDTIKSTTLPHTYLNYNIEMERGGKYYNITITPKQEIVPAGFMQYHLSILTNLDKVINIPVTLSIEPSLRVYPNPIFLGRRKLPHTFKLVIETRDSLAISNGKLTYQLDKATTKETTTELYITVTNPSGLAGLIEDNIVIKTKNSNHNLPLFITI